jgi:2-amino-4-hydroxy-6-hydroxymethyldihydropteridine diphosphokinase
VSRYFIGLGSNLGDRLANLRSAAAALAAAPRLSLGGSSGIWETRPVGPGTGPFLNAALELRYAGPTLELLELLLEIERVHGRLRRERWGDRTLDLDLLCGYADTGAELELELPGLRLPHPRLAARDFVLRPLADIDPSLLIAGQPCDERLAALAEDQRTLLRRLPEPLGFC